VVDATLMRGFNCFSGLKENGVAIINEKEGANVPKVKTKQKIFVIPATDIAMKTIGRPLGNTALIGAFAAATDELDLDTILEVIKKRFTGKAQEGNVEAVKQGCAYIKKLFNV
jgi:pyruvate ferredoxin oxidoreductase gamma subunit